MATIRPRRPSPDLRRRHRRIPVLWPGSLEQSGEGVDCAILNISGGGAKLRLTEPRACGGQIALKSPRFGAWRRGSYLLQQPPGTLIAPSAGPLLGQPNPNFADLSQRLVLH